MDCPRCTRPMAWSPSSDDDPMLPDYWYCESCDYAQADYADVAAYLAEQEEP